LPQVPKNARATPRYLLKIQTEVDAMQQLGGSLDAVFLQARPADGGSRAAVGRCDAQTIGRLLRTLRCKCLRPVGLIVLRDVLETADS